MKILRIVVFALCISAWAQGVRNPPAIASNTPTYGQSLQWLSSLGSTSFSGSGLNDGTFSGTYTGNASAIYCAQIDATGTPDTFKWGTNAACSNGATGVAITGAGQVLSSGVSISFAATTGHTLNAKWTVTASDSWTAAASGVAAGSVTLADMANLAANSIIGNNTGVSATPSAVPVAANVFTFLGTPSGANLAGAITSPGTTGVNIPLMWAAPGAFNLMIGTGSGGVTNSTGTNNVCLNASNLSCFFSLTSGSRNIGIGQSALFSLTSGSDNVALGNSLAGVTTGTKNVAIGGNANSNHNTNSVVAIGYGALQVTQTDEGVAVGYSALQSNTTGNVNVAVGPQALLMNTTGSDNVAVGPDVLEFQTTASDNVGMGQRALQSTTTGGQNVAIGSSAGYQPNGVLANANITGADNTWIGFQSGPGDATQYTFQTVIGANATGTCNNCVVLGRSSDQAVIPGTLAVTGLSTLAGVASGGTKFTVSGCATTSALTGGATAGSFATTTTGTCTAVITMNGATGLTAPNGWACSASDITAGHLAAFTQSASTPTTATISGTTTSGDTVIFQCSGY